MVLESQEEEIKEVEVVKKEEIKMNKRLPPKMGGKGFQRRGF